jgi:hypothetical protein
MSYSHGARSTRNHFVEPPSFLDRIRPVAPRPVRAIATVVRGRAAAAVRALLGAYERESRRSSRRSLIIVLVRLIFSVPNALLLLWIGTLWWGERTVFRDSVKACSWETWESWVSCPICFPSFRRRGWGAMELKLMGDVSLAREQRAEPCYSDSRPPAG